MNGPDAQPAPELSLPVLIIGGGACGLTAAIRLARSGVECVVIERDAVPAGSTALSSGFIPAAGTRVQRAAGVADSVDDFAADILAKTGGAAAAHLVQAYAGPRRPPSTRWNRPGCASSCWTASCTPVIAPAACTRCASARARR